MLELIQPLTQRIQQGKPLFSSLIVAVVLFGVSGAKAQSSTQEELPPYAPCNISTPTDGDITAAKGAFQAGQAAFNEADYPRSITYWEDAYRRDCTAHKLLVNLARAYELNGQLEHAVRALETYNERVPENPELSQSQTRIARFKRLIAERNAPKEPDAAPESPGTEPNETDFSGFDTEPSEPSAGGSKPLLPLFVAGGGLLVGTIGAVIYFPAQKKVADFEDQCPGRVCPADVDEGEGNSARRNATFGGVTALVGGAALVGGVVWYFLSDEKKPASSSQLSPTVGKGFAGLSFSGSF